MQHRAAHIADKCSVWCLKHEPAILPGVPRLHAGVHPRAHRRPDPRRGGAQVRDPRYDLRGQVVHEEPWAQERDAVRTAEGPPVRRLPGGDQRLHKSKLQRRRAHRDGSQAQRRLRYNVYPEAAEQLLQEPRAQQRPDGLVREGLHPCEQRPQGLPRARIRKGLVQRRACSGKQDADRHRLEEIGRLPLEESRRGLPGLAAGAHPRLGSCSRPRTARHAGDLPGRQPGERGARQSGADLQADQPVPEQKGPALFGSGGDAGHDHRRAAVRGRGGAKKGTDQ